jgi:hypothetical protein
LEVLDMTRESLPDLMFRERLYAVLFVAAAVVLAVLYAA